MIPAALIHKIRRLEVRTRGLVDNVFGGEYQSAFKGRGISFAEVRPYQIGDDIRSIDWNVSARTGETYVKVFEEEREQTLLLMIDVSASESFGSGAQRKRDLAAEVAALIAFSAVQNHDRVGLLLFTDRTEHVAAPRRGRRHALRIIRDVYTHRPAGRGTRIGPALEHARRLLNRRSIVVLLSDFQDEGYRKPLLALARRHDVAAIRLEDPAERELPPVGLVALRDAETGRLVTVDAGSAAVRRAWAERAEAQRRRALGLLREARVDSVALSTGAPYTEPLLQFFHRRNR